MMLVLLGFVSIMLQALLLKEYAVLFRNNEIVICVVLFFWLLGTGMGSALYRRLPESITNKNTFGFYSLIVASVAAQALVVVIRFVSGFFRYQAEPDIILLLLFAFLFLFPVSFCIGIAFPGLARTTRVKKTSVSYVYETLGFCFGGIVYSFLVVGNLSTMLCCAILLFASCFVSCIYFMLSKKRSYAVFPLLLAGILAILFSCWTEKLSRDIEWGSVSIDGSGGDRTSSEVTTLLDHGESAYGETALVSKQGLATLYYNGRAIAFEPADNLSEDKAHVPAFIHGKPGSILVLGYAEPGLIRGLLKHEPDIIVNVYIDKTLAEITKNHLVAEKRLVTISEDPAAWLTMQTDGYDMVYVNMQLPETLSDSRFTTVPFYNAVSRVLNEDGLCVVSLPYEENRLTQNSLDILRRLYANLSLVFHSVSMLPMESFLFAASATKISYSLDSLVDSVRQGGSTLGLQKLNKGYIKHYLDENRIASVTSGITRIPSVKHGTLFDTGIYASTLLQWLSTSMRDKWFVLAIAACVFAFVFYRKRKAIAGYFLWSFEGLVIFTAAFAGVAGELVLLSLYQFLFGYVYSAFAALVAIFMLGMGLGSGWRAFSGSGRAPVRVLLWIFALWLILIEALFFSYDSGALGGFIDTGSTGRAVIFLLMCAGGFINGSVFVVFTAKKEEMRQVAEVSAMTYAYDLFGSAAGSLLCGAVLIPLLGFAGCVSVVILLLAAAAVFFTLKRRKAG